MYLTKEDNHNDGFYYKLYDNANNELGNVALIFIGDVSDYQFKLSLEFKYFNNNTVKELLELLNNEVNITSLIYIGDNNHIKSALLKNRFINNNGAMTYFRGGTLYKFEEKSSGKFYIGSTLQDMTNYKGSGGEWRRFITDNNISFNGDVELTILRNEFNNERELREAELEEILKFCELVDGKFKIVNEKCLNYKTTIQPCNATKATCLECGSTSGCHKSTCSKYTEHTICLECGVPGGNHKKTCSMYKPLKEEYLCPHCNTPVGGFHKKDCPNYKEYYCPQCGGVNGHHKSSCDYYTPHKPCPECGSTGPHRNGCSLKESSNYKYCDICGNRITAHKTNCPLRDHSRDCPHCGTPAGGKHKKDCPNFVAVVCPECGGHSNTHKKTCSKYKGRTPCPECGSKSPVHKSFCSRYKPPKACGECGAVNGHKSTCSYYKPPKICQECGLKNGHHKKTCSQHKSKTNK